MAGTGSPAYPHVRSFNSCLAAARSACPAAGLSLAGLVGVADVTTTGVPQMSVVPGTRNAGLSWGNGSGHDESACI